MVRNVLAVSAAMALAAAPIAAQAAPQAAERIGARTGESEQLVGTTMWIVAAIALGLLTWGIIELTDDEEPESP